MDIKLFGMCGLCLLIFSLVNAQTVLEADGPGDTYELITSVLAPNFNPIEVPDCGHEEFGRHIDEIFDFELNKYVFRFHLHTSHDDDRCIVFDRQRNEIKTYDKSPDDLLAFIEDSVVYSWKFKLDEDFQPSTHFTHIHQIKAVGGPESSKPSITLTPRKATPNKLQLRYAESDTQITVLETELEPFLGQWIQATERILFNEGTQGKYELILTSVVNSDTLFYYTNNTIRTWKTDAEFLRPKWGIYRSLNVPSDLQDEEVLFADISIHKIDTSASNCSPEIVKADFNDDGVITASDLTQFLSVFGTPCSN